MTKSPVESARKFARELKIIGMTDTAKAITDLIEYAESLERNGFTLTKEQHERIKSWMGEHECDIYIGAIGGRFSYIFNPTSIGAIEKCVCACGQEIDVTDYESW